MLDRWLLSLAGSFIFFFFKQKTAYEMRISDWSSDVCSSDLSGSREEFAGWINRALDWCRDHHHMMRAWDEAMVLEPEFRTLAREGISALPNAMPSYLARWPQSRHDEEIGRAHV